MHALIDDAAAYRRRQQVADEVQYISFKVLIADDDSCVNKDHAQRLQTSLGVPVRRRERRRVLIRAIKVHSFAARRPPCKTNSMSDQNQV